MLIMFTPLLFLSYINSQKENAENMSKQGTEILIEGLTRSLSNKLIDELTLRSAANSTSAADLKAYLAFGNDTYHSISSYNQTEKSLSEKNFHENNCPGDSNCWVYDPVKQECSITQSSQGTCWDVGKGF